LKNQEFPSPEAFGFVARQMFQLAKPPNRYTPEYMIFKKYHEWEIRRYVPDHLSLIRIRASVETAFHPSLK